MQRRNIKGMLMAELAWGVKASLLRYVNELPDGDITVSGEASRVGDLFTFPGQPDSGDGVLRFSGTVRFQGHRGMLDLPIADPWIEPSEVGWSLTIIDPDEPGSRMIFALVEPSDGPSHSTALTEQGSELIIGPYERGTAFDDLTITA